MYNLFSGAVEDSGAKTPDAAAQLFYSKNTTASEKECSDYLGMNSDMAAADLAAACSKGSNRSQSYGTCPSGQVMSEAGCYTPCRFGKRDPKTGNCGIGNLLLAGGVLLAVAGVVGFVMFKH
jgi:hypothetical protein